MNRIIVSLTSYPARIQGITKVLDSIMRQTYSPDKIVLYLSEDQFAERKMPLDLSDYFVQGLEIHWCQGDMRSHKKYLYAFSEYPDDYIITVDDDYYYEKHMVEEFVQYTDKFPQCILARRTHLITAKIDSSISQYGKWWNDCMHYIGVPRMDLFAIGCGGILYPPRLLTNEVFNIDYIKKYCMYADDIWLKVMELISGIPVVRIPMNMEDRCDENFVNDGLYQHYNSNGGNDRQFQAVLGVFDNINESGMILTKKIFSTGTIYENEVPKMQQDSDLKIAREWMGRICSGCDIVIYGAGKTARRMYELLKSYKIVNKIRSFAVEDVDKNVEVIDGIKVLQYKKADYTNAVCLIAVADLSEQYRIRDQLQKIGFDEDRVLLLNARLYKSLYDLSQSVLSKGFEFR